MSESTLEREVLDRLIRIEAKLENWDKSKEQIYDNQREILRLKEKQEHQHREMGDDIREMQDGNKWLRRTTAGSAIAALISAIAAAIMAVLQ